MSGHADPRIPQAEDCVLRAALDRGAHAHPERVFAAYPDDRAPLTWGDLHGQVAETANGLRALGVAQGDHVLVWLPNGELMLRVLLAINYLGAVFVPLNTAYKGRLLEHAVTLSDAKLMVAHPDLARHLDGIETGALERIVVSSDTVETQVRDLEMHPRAALETGGRTPPELEREVQPWDIQCILYTSGTTGPSKAVLCPYAQVWSTATNTYPFMDARDRGVVYMPLFHIGGFSLVAWALVSGGSVALFDEFRTDTFWRDVRVSGGTFAIIMGAPATFLLKAERTQDEAETPLRHALMNPLSEEARRLAARVGFRAYGVFNMTETSSPLRTELDPATVNACGAPRPGVECRIVDAHDCETAAGEVGELIIRADAPWTMNAGYYRNPEATAEAWRNGWFHTGDAFKRDADGRFFFVDRIKDSIRRRGENISSAEVEFEVNAHPDVKETAAIAVRSEHTEDEVMVVVRPVEGRGVDPEALLRWLLPRMAHYMVPRYIRIVDDFPRTPTQRIRKHILREAGVTPDAWDREAAGIKVRRERLGS